MASDLVERVRTALRGYEGITEKRMFGSVAFLLHGNMLLAVSDHRLMARVGPALYEEALARDHVRERDFTGRPSGGDGSVGRVTPPGPRQRLGRPLGLGKTPGREPQGGEVEDRAKDGLGFDRAGEV